MKKVRIVAAGNVEIPAYLALERKGYKVHREIFGEEEQWFARKDGCEFVAEGPIELLGVVSVFEVRGQNWKATDQEIDGFMEHYKT